ncbi:antibiotic biosynthesis monooxygenase family protein [Fodinicola feengrottensis]|uniref:antibiotic biosynthesis monooxygenase family protein n=1 Tax=Fodinicola feengrottensis TaxID=435914 RepID=UPI0013D1D47F|nr:antibiotic biosynthesis monooxygenase [Fodinicola feengrottensis]
MSNRVRVLVWHRIAQDGPDRIPEIYRGISEDLARTPGLLANELLYSRSRPGTVAVMSEWRDMDAFLAWEQGPDHRGTTAGLRPYRDLDRDPQYELYEVAESFVSG